MGQSEEPGSSFPPEKDDRLDSWKEIAVYLNRDVRTVRRWEKDQGLPVRRHQHQKAASVYAYRAELDEWWKGKEDRQAQEQPDPSLNTEKAERVTSGSVAKRWASAVLFLAVVVAAALLLMRKTAPPAPKAAKPMFAVLPFQNLTGDPAQEFVTDGLTEEMITQISQVEGNRLGVIARTSSMAYKRSPKTLKQIGRELGADYVLEGSVRRSGDRVRVSAQLIEAKSQTHLWAENFESDRRDILRLQSDVAYAIAHQIQLVIPGAAVPSEKKLRSVDPEVYDLCLLGRYEWNKRTDEGLKKAVAYFEQAVGRDPGYAPAQADLAEAYLVSAFYSHGSQRKFYDQAQSAAQQAIRLDDRTFNAHTVLGMIASSYLRSGAEPEFKRALEINPSYATGHHWYAFYLWRVGRHEEALAEAERARELDPVSPIINTDEAVFRMSAGQTDEAIRQLRMTTELTPDFSEAHRSLAVAYAKQRKFDEALAESRKALELNPTNVGARATLGYVYAVSGNRKEAVKVLQRLRADSANDSLLFEAWIETGLGETDQAIASLEKEYAARTPMMVAISLEPIFQPLRSDTRFADLLRRIQNGQ